MKPKKSVVKRKKTRKNKTVNHEKMNKEIKGIRGKIDAPLIFLLNTRTINWESAVHQAGQKRKAGISHFDH